MMHYYQRSFLMTRSENIEELIDAVGGIMPIANVLAIDATHAFIDVVVAGGRGVSAHNLRTMANSIGATLATATGKTFTLESAVAAESESLLRYITNY